MNQEETEDEDDETQERETQERWTMMCFGARDREEVWKSEGGYEIEYERIWEVSGEKGVLKEYGVSLGRWPGPNIFPRL